jgi:hypothetical protein
MDRNGHPNPFAGFDDLVPKVAPPSNPGNFRPTASTPLNSTIPNFSTPSHVGFAPTPATQSNGQFNGGTFSPSSPQQSGFPVAQQSRPGISTQPSNYDSFGFPVAAVQQPKPNPFDVFAGRPAAVLKPTMSPGSIDFTASTSRPLPSPMAMGQQNDTRSAAFGGFTPSAPAIVSSQRPVQDPFASISTAPSSFTASSPVKPQKLPQGQMPQLDANVYKPSPVFNPFDTGNQIMHTPSTTFSTISNEYQNRSQDAYQPTLPQSQPFPKPVETKARVFGQASIPPAADNSFAPSTNISTTRVFASAPIIAMPPTTRSSASLASPFDGYQPAIQSAPILSAPVTPSPFDGFKPSIQPVANLYAAPASVPASPFDGFQPSTQPVLSTHIAAAHVAASPFDGFLPSTQFTPTSSIQRVPSVTNGDRRTSFSLAPPPTVTTKATSASSFSASQPPTPAIKVVEEPAQAESSFPQIPYNKAAKPLAVYQGPKKAKAATRVPAQGVASFNRRKDESAIWTKPYFADLFTKPYFEDKDDVSKSQSVANVRQSIRIIRDALFRMVTDKDSFMETRYSSMVAKALELFDSGCEIFDRFPSRSGDNDKLFSFIDFFMQRVRGMPVGSVLLVPVGWLTESGMQKTVFNNLTGNTNKPPPGSTLGTECAAVLILHRCKGTADNKDFNVTIVNTNNVPDSGIDYHAVKIDPVDGSLLHNISFEFRNIDNERVYNTSFWLLLFKSAVHSNVKFGSKFLYERVLPYLTMMPVTHSLTRESERVDFFPLPPGGDKSGINCAFECLRQVIRQQGADDLQATHVPLMIKWDMLKSIQYEMQDLRAILPLEIDTIRMACRDIAKSAARQVGPKTAESSTTVSGAQLTSISDSIAAVNLQLQEMDERMVAPPAFSVVADERLSRVCEWPLYGRLRRDFDVEALAGDAPVAPIIRPVEMTLVPDNVSDFQGVAAAMRHALNLCVLLANQRSVVRNSYTLRVCMLEHLFVRVIPLPLPINHNRRDTECFWHAQPMRFETQADILRLLSKLSIHFATGSLSVKSNRSGDAVRMLTFACMATIGDAALRKIACDIPSQSSLHYSGRAKGPIHPFGFELGTFEEESEYLKLSHPESAVARTQVLDYFHQMKKTVSPDHMLFSFEKGSECNIADKYYIDQLCMQMGFKRGEAVSDLTTPTKGILQLYPEIAYFRDLIFMFKLVMVPTLEMLPEVKCWEPEEAVLSWGYTATTSNGVSDHSYVVSGFGRRLECTHLAISVEEQQLKYKLPRGIFSRFLRYVGVGTKKPRSTPSQANPSILLGERVDTEDDILHIRNLPDFDGTLGARDCELMLQYLTAPYMRIPLLLSFFSNEVRLKALRNTNMQEVLDAALFEPGQWKCDYDIPLPSQIPAAERDHLCTPVGLLFNEIVMSPNAILASVLQMLEKVVDMDSGKYSELGESILYVTRLAIRVEGYLLFLIRNKRFHSLQKESETNMFNGANVQAGVRGLRCGEDVVNEAVECQKKIRVLLEEKMFKIIARWIKRSKKDGRFGQACMLHAHLAFIYRNVEPEELTPRVVFTMLASQIFLFNYYKYDLDIEVDSKKYNSKEKEKEKDASDANQFDLTIPNVELFGMFQRNRGMILNWLQNAPDERNKVHND